MKSCLLGMIAALSLLGGVAAPAKAQSQAPVGTWVSQGNEVLIVTNNGLCWFGVGSQVTTSGSCGWRASARGGILTIISGQLYKPAPIYFNVVWINQTTISVDDDIFTRRM